MPAKSIALITGANKGIGLAIARRLGERDFSVWLGCRDQGRGEGAAAELKQSGIDARSLVLDVTDGDSVGNAATRLGDQVETLDVLVNNAGVSIGPVGLASDEPVEDIARMFDVNVLGPVRVTQAFLPLLRRSGAGRIVMMSSGLGSITEATNMAGLTWNVGYAGYSASKSALNMITVKFAKELLTDGIKVNAADPGFTATDLNAHTGHRTVDGAATIAVALATLGPTGPTGGFFHDGHAEPLSRYAW